MQNKNWIEPELYKQIVDKTVLACVDIIVVFQDHYLVIKRKEEPAKDEWWAVGGRILKNEKMEDAVKRVCKSEVGLDVIPRRILGVEETIFKTGKFNSGCHSLNCVWLATTDSDKVQLDSNHSNYGWIPCSQIPDYLPKYLKNFLELAFFDY